LEILIKRNPLRKTSSFGTRTQRGKQEIIVSGKKNSFKSREKLQYFILAEQEVSRKSNYLYSSMYTMKNQGTNANPLEKLPILEKLDLLLKSTRNLPLLLQEAEKNSIISSLEKDTIVTRFENGTEQVAAFYLLLNSKSCPATQVLGLLNTTGNESAGSVFQEKKQDTNPSRLRVDSRSETTSELEKAGWRSLQQVITENIDRLSSHTRNLGLVLCFASGTGLITGKDREIIANYSQLEIDQLKKFYTTVSGKEEDAYGKLLKVLRMTSNNWALDVLQIGQESD